MEINKQNILILAFSVVIASGILLAGKKQPVSQQVESRVYVVNGGWGYDILVSKKLFIHQESVPVLQTLQPFKTKEEAELVAGLVVQKLESGHTPTLSKFDLEKILPAYLSTNGQDRKDQ